MKVISVTQPMAWAIFHGKDVENRTWKTNYRGKLLIHASKTFNYQHKNIAERILNFPIPLKKDLTFGAIIGEVDLVDCVRGHSSRWAAPDQWNWVLANAHEYKVPIPMKGKLGLFEVKI